MCVFSVGLFSGPLLFTFFLPWSFYFTNKKFFSSCFGKWVLDYAIKWQSMKFHPFILPGTKTHNFPNFHFLKNRKIPIPVKTSNITVNFKINRTDTNRLYYKSHLFLFIKTRNNKTPCFVYILKYFLYYKIPKQDYFWPPVSCTGRGGLDPELEAFRAAMEAKQKEDEDSPPGTQYFK